MTIKYLLRVVIVSVVFTTLQGTLFSKFSQFLLKKLRTSNSEISFSNVSLVVCAWKCLRNNGCLSINFNSLTNMCELNFHKIALPSDSLEENAISWKIYENGKCALSLSAAEHCYYTMLGSKSWTESRSDCHLLGGDLAGLNTEAEINNVFDCIKLAGLPNNTILWLGAEKDGEIWRWTDGTEVTIRTPVTQLGELCLRSEFHLLTGIPIYSGVCSQPYRYVCEVV